MSFLLTFTAERFKLLPLSFVNAPFRGESWKLQGFSKNKYISQWATLNLRTFSRCAKLKNSAIHFSFCWFSLCRTWARLFNYFRKASFGRCSPIASHGSRFVKCLAGKPPVKGEIAKVNGSHCTLIAFPANLHPLLGLNRTRNRQPNLSNPSTVKSITVMKYRAPFTETQFAVSEILLLTDILDNFASPTSSGPFHLQYNFVTTNWVLCIYFHRHSNNLLRLLMIYAI